MTERYAFIIGKGELPNSVIKDAKQKKLDFILVGIMGLSPKLLVNSYNNFWFHIGKVNDLINGLKKNNITHIVMVGSIARPSLLSIKLDNLGKQIVRDYYSKMHGDDSLLKIIISIFEENGFIVIGAQNISNSILSENKSYNNIDYTNHIDDIKNGFLLAEKLSQLDIGQSIIFQQNMVIAVEAVEGTKNMILRSKKLLKSGKKGILIKISKINQDSRVDLPSIGSQTIIQAKKAGLAGIVIQAKKTIILNEEKTTALAEKYKIFLLSIDSVNNL